MRSFLLLSDLHACDVDPASSSAPSYVSCVNAAGSGKLDPLAELDKLIRDENLAPDCVLCPGDITNRSNPSSLNYAWGKLNKLATTCNARLIATVGNHDLNSRYKLNKFDPRGYLMKLEPRIPVGERERFLEYWAENFTLISSDKCNILVLNTAAYHGGGQNVAAEIEHGRISEITLAAIKATLQSATKADVNIVLCHHHPIKADQGDEDLVGLTRGGEKLVEVLGEEDSAWIVIHGHKHVPDLFYGHGGSNAPVIFACASFSAQVNADAQNKNPNQVHLLVCDPDAARRAQLTSAGYVRSWTWQPGIGWRRSQGSHGLPHFVGFGYRSNVKFLADKLNEYLTANSLRQTSWSAAVAAIPELKMLIPSDFVTFERVLEQKSLTILRDRDGSLAQVGRRS